MTVFIRLLLRTYGRQEYFTRFPLLDVFKIGWSDTRVDTVTGYRQYVAARSKPFLAARGIPLVGERYVFIGVTILIDYFDLRDGLRRPGLCMFRPVRFRGRLTE
jgi:hypothetical protein